MKRQTYYNSLTYEQRMALLSRHVISFLIKIGKLTAADAETVAQPVGKTDKQRA